MRDDDGDDECKKVVKETTFRRELLSLCQREFQKDKRDDEAREEMLKPIEEAAPVSVHHLMCSFAIWRY